jgi:hypothetical protein
MLPPTPTIQARPQTIALNLTAPPVDIHVSYRRTVPERLSDFKPEPTLEATIQKAIEKRHGEGRPEGLTYPDRPSYVAAIRERIYAKPDRLKKLPIVKDFVLAGWLGFNVRTLYRHNDTYGLTLPNIRQQKLE